MYIYDENTPPNSPTTNQRIIHARSRIAGNIGSEKPTHLPFKIISGKCITKMWVDNLDDFTTAWNAEF
jgi:hypothetical protein